MKLVCTFKECLSNTIFDKYLYVIICNIHTVSSILISQHYHHSVAPQPSILEYLKILTLRTFILRKKKRLFSNNFYIALYLHYSQVCACLKFFRMCRENDMVGKVCNAQHEALCLDTQCLVTPVHTHNPSNWKAETERSYGLAGQPF